MQFAQISQNELPVCLKGQTIFKIHVIILSTLARNVQIVKTVQNVYNSHRCTPLERERERGGGGVNLVITRLTVDCEAVICERF